MRVCCLKVVYGETGGRLLHRRHPEAAGAVPLSYRALATPGLARRVAALGLTNRGRAEAVRVQLLLDASRTPTSRGSPRLLLGTAALSDLMERIFLGPTFQAWIRQLRLAAGALRDEFSDLFADGSVLVTQATTGQRPQGIAGPSSDRQENTCISVRGRTGGVLALEPHKAEGFTEVGDQILYTTSRWGSFPLMVGGHFPL